MTKDPSILAFWLSTILIVAVIAVIVRLRRLVLESKTSSLDYVDEHLKAYDVMGLDKESILIRTNLNSTKKNYPPSYICISRNIDNPVIFIDTQTNVGDKYHDASSLEELNSLLVSRWSEYRRACPNIYGDEPQSYIYKSLFELYSCVPARSSVPDFITLNYESRTPKYLLSVQSILELHLSELVLLDNLFDFSWDYAQRKKSIIQSLMCSYINAIQQFDSSCDRATQDGSSVHHLVNRISMYSKKIGVNYLGIVNIKLSIIRECIWVHHTSNQHYAILGFVFGLDSIIYVVYYNVRNYAVYSRPATDWLRSMAILNYTFDIENPNV